MFFIWDSTFKKTMLFLTEITICWLEYPHLGKRVSYRKRCESLVVRELCIWGNACVSGRLHRHWQQAKPRVYSIMSLTPLLTRAGSRVHLLQLNAGKCLMNQAWRHFSLGQGLSSIYSQGRLGFIKTISAHNPSYLT